MYLIIDLSNNNAEADLTRVKQSGVIGMWHKVTEGLHFVDKLWTPRRDFGRREGLRVGGYHFARGAGAADGKAQALMFIERLGAIGRHDLAPVLDQETTEGAGSKGLLEYARAFMHEVEHETGVWPLYYSYPSFIEALHATHVIGRGLWLASYGRDDGSEHPYTVPAPFKKALAHQYASRARVAGVRGFCDVSHARRLVPILARGWRGLARGGT